MYINPRSRPFAVPVHSEDHSSRRKYSKSSLNVVNRFLESATLSEMNIGNQFYRMLIDTNDLSSYSILLVTKTSPNF